MASMLSKMPWRSHEPEAKQAGQDEEGESLTTILSSSEDRSALTILIADCTGVMRQQIEHVFDPQKTGRIDGDGKYTKDTKAGADTKDDADAEKQKEVLEQRKKEVGSEALQELKKAALQHFDEWSAAVIQRVGEVLNTREEPAKKQSNDDDDATPERVAPPMRFPALPEYDNGVDDAIKREFEAVDSPLASLPEEKRVLILHSVLLLLLSLERYHAQSRVLLLHLTTSLRLSIKFLGHDESKVARGLLTAAENLKADEETKKRQEENQGSRKWKVGLATVAGAALIGVTGGLAAPLLAAGVGSVMGGLGLGATAAAGYLGTLAGSTVLVGGLFGAYGGRMTGKMMDQYAREVEDFGFVPIRSAHRPRKIEKEYRRLRVGIGISGWLSDQNDVTEPWKVLGVEMESFALRWELEALMNLGNGLNTMIKSAAWGFAKGQIIKHTVFAALSAGLWPLALLKVSRIVENPWSVASYRATKAGEVLADAIINKAQGERPVTLVGYSLGAKVIYTCLQRLAERKAFGLVESAILIGTPSPSASADWRMLRTVVSGRVVNVYSMDDYLLGFLHRGSSASLGVAGLQAIEGVFGIENVDVTDMVNGHTSYRFLTGPILRKIGFEDVDSVELEKEKAALQAEEEKEAMEREESERKEKASGNADEGVSDQHIQDLEKEVQKKNEQSYIGWAQQKMVGAGASASTAYEKAKAQWFERQQAQNTDAGDATGSQSPRSGDASYQAMKAKSEARKASQAPKT